MVYIPRHILNFFTVVAIGGTLTACGDGFEAAPTAHNDDIVYKINSTPRAANIPLNVMPREMPSLPPGTGHVDIGPFSDLPPERVIEPALDKSALTPFVDGEVNLADINVSPYYRVGKTFAVFPSTPSGFAEGCTAQLIGNTGVVLTAAHCVYDNQKREWPNTYRFELQYNSGVSAGSYDWHCIAMVSGWPNKHYPYDYAIVKLRGTPPGGLGMTINVKGTPVDAVGYPGKYYDGEQLVHVTGKKNGVNPSAMPGNGMGKGSSGGAWIADTGGGLTDAVSVNSFFYTNDPNTMYGPQLTPTTLKIYEFAARGCKDQVAPAGSEPALLVVDEKLHDAENLLIRRQLDITAGVMLTIDPDPACGCGGQANFAVNTSDNTRLIGVQTITTNGSFTANVSVSYDYLAIGSGERKVLSCIKSSVPDQASCQVDKLARLTSERRFLQNRNLDTKGVPGLTIAQMLAVDDIGRCVAACEKADSDVCLDLGKGAIPVLKPLANFSADIVTAPVSDGVVVKKDDIIAEFGGDPANNPDICERTDVRRTGTQIENDGFGCFLKTKSIGGAALKTRLNMRASIRGNPSAWNKSLSALTPQPATYFPDREFAPAIDFEGSPAFTKKYAGDVYASTKIASDRLVVATSNGCLWGYFK